LVVSLRASFVDISDQGARVGAQRRDQGGLVALMRRRAMQNVDQDGLAATLRRLVRPNDSRSGRGSTAGIECNTIEYVRRPFDLDALDDIDPFEIDRQAAHLFKHDPHGTDSIYEIWNSDPLFYPAKPPAHWLMVADPAKCRPIGCYVAAKHLADRYRVDR
jgi:hypothetical protein